MLLQPQSDAIFVALRRCSVGDQEAGRWSVWLAGAIEQYRLDLEREAREAEGGSAAVTKELNHFHRSLRRSNNPTVGAKRIARLSETARIFINMRLRLQTPPIDEIDQVDLSIPTQLEALLVAVGTARSWLGNKPGTEHPPALRCLVQGVALIYKQITGKTPGLSSSQTTLGPGYMTPFEELLSATLAEASPPRTPEAMRSLYRALERGKPKR
ncbi:MAG: hypothetical protein ACO22Z_07490 [Paracoccaceae bacterium]